MPSISLNIEQTIDVFSSMVGEYVWFVRAGEFRILLLDFGDPRLTVREPRPVSHGSDALRGVLNRRRVVPTGRWHLFVENGLWTVDTQTSHCHRRDAATTDIESCLAQLDGQKLVSVAFDDTRGAWIFTFDLSGVLRIEAGDDRGDEWVLFFADGGNLTYSDPQNIVMATPR